MKLLVPKDVAVRAQRWRCRDDQARRSIVGAWSCRSNEMPLGGGVILLLRHLAVNGLPEAAKKGLDKIGF